jgi:hypothetical protein
VSYLFSLSEPYNKSNIEGFQQDERNPTREIKRKGEKKRCTTE